jgi:hypothetical protein
MTSKWHLTDEAAMYHIRVRGSLTSNWSDWFDGFAVIPLADGETLLTGIVRDQSALHGLLTRIRDLGLPLLSVQKAEESLGPSTH